MKFCVVFGDRPNGWYEVTAASQEEAEAKIQERLIGTYAFLHLEEDFNASLFPEGCLGVFE